jgi:ankyrin repeat protein
MVTRQSSSYLLSRTDIAVNTQTDDGETALIAASRGGHRGVVELLLSHTDIAVNTQTNGWTALIAASHDGHEAIVEHLLSRTDIAVNTQTDDGETALIAASRGGHRESSTSFSHTQISPLTYRRKWLDGAHCCFLEWSRGNRQAPSLSHRYHR